MKKVIEVALSYEGWKETNSSNLNPFAEYLDSVPGFYNGKKNGYAWCDVFVDFCFCKAYGVETAKKLLCQPSNSLGAGCIYSAQYYKQQGRFFTSNPQEGDQIFFGSASNCYHTGLVIGVENGRVLTIEGNTSDSVARSSYKLNDPQIYGYGRPDWGIVGRDDPGTPCGTIDNVGRDDPGTPCGTTALVGVPELSVNDEIIEAVRAMQALLNLRIGARLDTDGEFGPLTKAAVMTFQSMRGLDVDGICGKNTWAALINNENFGGGR